MLTHEISEHRHGNLLECPRSRFSTGHTCLQHELVKYRYKTFAIPSRNTVEKKKEKTKTPAFAKHYALPCKCINVKDAINKSS